MDTINSVFLNVEIGFYIKVLILKKLYYIGAFDDIVEISAIVGKFCQF